MIRNTEQLRALLPHFADESEVGATYSINKDGWSPFANLYPHEVRALVEELVEFREPLHTLTIHKDGQWDINHWGCQMDACPMVKVALEIDMRSFANLAPGIYPCVLGKDRMGQDALTLKIVLTLDELVELPHAQHTIQIFSRGTWSITHPETCEEAKCPVALFARYEFARDEFKHSNPGTYPCALGKDADGVDCLILAADANGLQAAKRRAMSYHRPKFLGVTHD